MPAPDPALAEIARILRNGDALLVIAALVADAKVPIEELVFVLLSPASAEHLFALPPGTRERTAPLGCPVPVAHAQERFRALGQYSFAEMLALNLPAGMFRMVIEEPGGWSLLYGSMARLPRIEQAKASHVLGLALVGANGQCAGDVCSTFRAGSA